MSGPDRIQKGLQQTESTTRLLPVGRPQRTSKDGDIQEASQPDANTLVCAHFCFRLREHNLRNRNMSPSEGPTPQFRIYCLRRRNSIDFGVSLTFYLMPPTCYCECNIWKLLDEASRKLVQMSTTLSRTGATCVGPPNLSFCATRMSLIRVWMDSSASDGTVGVKRKIKTKIKPRF